MMNGGDPSTGLDRLARIERALAEYFQAVESETAPEPAVWLARYPDLRPELGERLAAAAGMCGLVDSQGRAAVVPGEVLAADAPTVDPRQADTDPTGTLAQRSGVGLTSPGLATGVGQTTVGANHDALSAGGDGGTAPGSLTHDVRARYFGDYEIRRELGRGGMGVVYEARQMTLNRPVALKMIRAGVLAGGDDLRRFQNEAEAVAMLDHSGIVPVHEVGEHAGQRYFSMKLVSGGSLAGRLDAYRDDARAAARLVAEAAEAVHHAHQRGILHRDLKPANVLIDEQGHPHITDFGLARRVGDDSELTESGAILGTPAYMAPEQASGHRAAVTTASDIYGLGAVLYAVLAGRAPFGGESVVETLDAVRNRPPEPPSRLNVNVPRDLEIICLKCLEKEPSRRYATARDLAEDLRRWLAGEPIAARPVGRVMRLWMWGRRNPAITGMATSLALALVGGLAGTTWKWREAEHRKTELTEANRIVGQERNAAITARDEAQRRRIEAEQEAAKARAVVSFLVDDILAQAAPEKNARSRRVTIEDALDLAGPAIGQRFARQPEVEVPVRVMVGRTYRKLGKLDKAEPHLRLALELSRRNLGERALQALEATDDLATLLQDRGQLAEAESLFRSSLEGHQRTLGPDAKETLGASNNLAVLLTLRGKLAEAESLLHQIVETRKVTLGPDDPATLNAMSNLAIVLKDRGKLAEAEPLLRTVLEARTRIQGLEHPDTLMTLNSLASLLQQGDKLAEAEPISRRLLEIRRRVLGPDHPDTLIAMNNLALLLRSRGRLDEAEAMIRACLEARRRVLGPEHPHTLIATSILASILQDRGKLAEAEPLFRAAYDTGRRTQGDEHPETLTLANNLALVLHLLGRLDEAEALFRRALMLKQGRFGPDNPRTAITAQNLASLLRDRGGPAAAEPLLRHALEIDRRALGPNHNQTVQAMEILAATLLDLGRPVEAEPLARDARTIRASNPRAGRGGAPFAQSVLGACLAARGREAEAEPLLIAGYEGLRANPGSSPHQVRQALERVITFYESRGRHTQTDAWRVRRLDANFPADPFAR
jgi:tetratricopeptide (TPR) repeat protein